MSNEVAKVEANSLEEFGANTTLAMSGGDNYETLDRQMEAMEKASRIAVAICSTKLAPKAYQGHPEDGAAAIMYGMELGLTPIQSLQQIMVINGKPGIEARTAIALIRKHGYVTETLESSNERVTVRITDPTGVEEICTWDIARATMAGYTKNELYKKIPQQMLYAKAAMEAARKIAPHILSGLPYSQEELRLDAERMEARRQDQGLDAVRQALADKQQQALPAQPAATGGEEILQSLLADIAAADSKEALEAIMALEGARTQLSKQDDARVREAATARLATLTNGGEQ